MLDFHFIVNADLSALESQMADVQGKLDEIKATIEAEKAEVADAVAALTVKIDELKAAIEAGEADDALLVANLDEIKAGVAGIFTQPAE